jgi:chlorite dismutase
LAAGESGRSRRRLEHLCVSNANPCHPRLTTYANVGGKADFAFFLLASGLAELSQMHRELEACFPAGVLVKVFSYLSVTELTEYGQTDDDHRRLLLEQEKLEPESEAFQKRLGELRERTRQYEKYRLYPEMPDWEVMAFYPMSKRRAGADNWYSLDSATPASGANTPGASPSSSPAPPAWTIGNGASR